jgi:hypothetical protein
MRLLEKSLVPLDHYSMLNLFTDLLINESLGRELAPELSAVYRAFHGEIRGKRDPVFLFVMAVYEELWGQPVGSLMGPGWEDFARRYPMHRVDARLVAQKLFPMASNIYLQLLYFLSLASRYLAPLEGDKPESYDPYDCIGDEPSPEDWADALIPSAREREALARALKEGWLRQEDHDRVQGQSALERRVALLPGQGTGDASMVPEIMAAYYRQQAERLLIKPPPAPVMGEAVVPTSLDEWEPGDAVRDIDWLQTLSQRGPVLGAAAPLKRTLIAEVDPVLEPARGDLPRRQRLDARPAPHAQRDDPGGPDHDLGGDAGGRGGAGLAVLVGVCPLLVVVSVRDGNFKVLDALCGRRDKVSF